MTPEEVVKDIDKLNGRTVSVTGYLADCSGYDCVLFTDEKQAELARSWMIRFQAAAKAHKPFTERPIDSWYVNSLGIGSGNEFDQKAAPFRHSYVLITGKVTNRCRWKGEPGCTDRSTDLEPLSISGWQRPSVSKVRS
jgi:hypothetical protein